MLLAVYISISAALVVSATGSTLPRHKQEVQSLWFSPNDVKIEGNRDAGDDACGEFGGICRPLCHEKIEREGRINNCTGDYVCCKKYRNTRVQDIRSAVWGDPQYQTFDGKHFKFDGHGGCSYVLFQECNHMPAFVVAVRHHYVELLNKTAVTEVTVYAEGNAVTTTIGRDVFVNSKQILTPSPWTIGSLKISNYDEHVKITMNSKFSLLWNGRGRVAPVVNASMFGKVCGLMGNADDNPDNDMQIRMPDGTLKSTDNVNKFGESWIIPSR
uniref:Zonadhesin-like n=1 Tax=Saccoglossus kowalevskii TaxID=10224 RepID=A0ABM0LYN6_SACKO|nr:PREDICTED: zonadhesin-like [Saccoglossus kowalevskii]